MTPFLPPNYDIPSASGRYFKLLQGENRLRILDSPILGNLYWKEEGGKRKPVRRPMGTKISTAELEESTGDSIKHFWALPVWSYRDNAVMIWEVTQKGILKAIKDLVADEDWNNPREYDLLIKRTGEGMETEYSVLTKKPTPLSDDITKAWEDVQFGGFDLTALFQGDDPFAGAHTVIPMEDILDVADDIFIEEV